MFSAILRKLRNAPAPQAAEPAEDWIGSGNALLGQGKLLEALACYEKAVAADPGSAAARVNAGYALLELERHAEAKDSLQKAVALDGQNLDAHYLLGRSLAAEADFAGAAASFASALRLKPTFAFAHVDLAKAQERLELNEEAAQSYERAIACDPELAADVGMELARLLADTQQWEAALSRLDRISPDHVRWKALRGAALNGLGQSTEALAVLDDAIRENPQDLNALHTRGNVLFGLRRYRDSVADSERVLSHQPDVVEVLSNCGAAWQKLGERSKARGLLERALQLRPAYGAGTYNLAICLLELGDCRGAIECCEQGLAFNPGDANLHWNKAVGHFLLGELGRAWPEHEWRWDAKALGLRSVKPSGGKPMWTGREDLAGKTILLTAEQGLGDTIQFIRYAPLLAAKGARVLLRVPQLLEPLFKDLGPGCVVSPDGSAWPAHDFQCPLLSLPLAFATEIDTVPRNVPYLRSEPARLSAWQERLGAKTEKRVGLVWSGNAAHSNDGNRSIPLRTLLAALPRGLQLVSLQKELRAGDEQALAEFGVLHYGAQLESFVDTAALVDTMDLVISVDTSVAHLAGAMGKPLWLLLPFLPDWRWMLKGDASPWYPTARLFRQDEGRRWEDVLSRVAAELPPADAARAPASA